MQMWTSWCESYKSATQKIIGSNLKKKRRKDGYIWVTMTAV